MLRISALNDSLSSQDSQANPFVKEATKEAKEAETYSLYNKALGLLRHGDTDKAEAVFRDLIDHDFLQEAADLLEEKGKDAIHPGLQLLYSIYKNLAAMATQKKDFISAMESYLEAVKIDNSETTVWYKIGMTALKIEDFQLAKGAFEEGLECNPKHWPCLDNIIPVMFALNNYSECLYFISRAFEMEIYYDKGHAIRNKIYKDQPCLQSDTEEFFQYCDKELSTVKIDPAEAKEYVEEALQMRRRRQELSKPPDPVILKFPERLKEYSWQCVGETLIGLYDKAVNSDPIISLGLTVDVPDYEGVPSEKETLKDKKTETEDSNSDLAEKPSTSKESADEESIPMDTDEKEELPKAIETEEKKELPKAIETFERKEFPNSMETEQKIELPNAMEIEEKKELTKAMETEKEKKELSTAMETEKTEAEGEKNMENIQTEENKEELATESEKEMESYVETKEGDGDKGKTPESDDGHEKMEVSDGKPDSLETLKTKTEETDIAVSHEGSDSLMEAVSVAHSLLDSLSPAKAIMSPGDTWKTDSTSSVAKNIEAELDDKSKIDSVPEEKMKPTVDLKSDVKLPSLVKISSLGFVVGASAVDSKDIIPDTPDMDVLYVLPSPKIDSTENKTDVSEQHIDANTTKNDNGTASDISETKPNIDTAVKSGQPKPTVPENVTVIDLTSDNESQSEMLVTPPSVSRATVTSFSVHLTSLTSSPMAIPKPVYTGTDLMSPITSSKQSITSPPNTAVSMETDKSTPHAPIIVVQDFLNKDHAYSKASSKFSSDPQMTSPQGQGQMLLSGSIPVTQALVKNVESTHTLDASPSIAQDLDDRNQGAKRVQKKRKISLATEEIMMYGKRRSTRVRNTGKKKEEEPANLKDLLKEFLPSSLKTVQEDDSIIMDSSKDESFVQDKSSLGENSAGKAPVPLNFTQWEEMSDVKDFLKDLRVKNSGLVDVLNRYLHVIARNWKLKWTEALCPVYIRVFERARKHVYMPNVLDTCDAPDIFQEMALICLALSELQLDYWLGERSKVTGSPNLSPVGKTGHTLLEENIPAFFEEDLMFMTVLCGQSDRLDDDWIDHCCRVYWMKSKYAILLGKIEEAIYSYERLKEYLEYMKEEFDREQVVLPNCKTENLITLDVVTAQQDLLQKSHCVEETQRLYDMAEYEQVVEILLQTFSQPQHKAKVMKVESSERRSQLCLLQDAMFKTGNNGRSALWGEESLNEAYVEYKASDGSDDKTAWIKTIIDVLSYLHRVLCRDISAIRSLPSAKLVRLSQNLIKMIDKNMSQPESITEMMIDTVMPWAVLYQLIKNEEDKIVSMRLRESNSSDDLEDAISSSQSLLIIAHDYLGGRSWCTKSDGALLLFFMDVLKEKLDQESDNEEDYQQAFEQCVYCLFGHPNKKAKAKHLQDHNVTGVTLHWEHAVKVFDYFKPKAVPEFDGYKSETISTELEVLLKRIIPLVPEEYKSKVLSTEDVQSYIEGSKDTPPSLKEDTAIENPVLEDIYYLLGDYYLKNKESVKAIKFYTHDLCVNPDRLDSWAGMALARMSQLESKLTSAEMKMDAPLYKKSIAALRCFKRATEIDDSNAKLWLEYGTLAYQLHAHASKQIRWKKWFAMEQEVVDIAMASRREMLQTAFDCFRQASDWNEEEWLHNYMLGKCMEKMRKPAKDILQYYFQALINVHEEGAKYPKKIVYAYTTPHLSVECLEMYYRIHVVILKCLMKHPPESEEIDYKLLATSVVEANFTPFVFRVEKGQETKLDRESASSADESSCSAANTPTPKSSQGTTDHTYYRQKSNQDSSSGITSTKTSDNTENIESGKKSPSVVTTMELHADQSSDNISVTTTTTEVTAQVVENEISREDPIPLKKSENLQKMRDPQGGQSDESAKSTDCEGDDSPVEETAKSVLKGIVDMVVEKSEEKVSSVVNQTRKVATQDDVESDKMEVDDDNIVKTGAGENVTPERKEPTSMDEDTFQGIIKGIKLANLSSKKEEMLESLLKLSKEDLHRELTDQCRKAFELCLNRFPTHYKSHYRLAYIYSKNPYFMDLEKAHTIMLGGSVKWQKVDYMPCQALFGERKMTKFFQGIWKIPIDEIDRAGSFPSHLNRCIELTLNILKDGGDYHSLHQVHLLLNRQPEPGKKYLRDAEKKYYALMSHRYTLDAAEAKINDMKSISDTEQRHKFLLLFYKVWEHGVHKLNKQVDRTNKLLAEAYRVVVRKLETLPHNMLLDQAVRYCKHLMAQKLKSDKDSRPQSSESSSDNKSKPGIKLSTAGETVKTMQQISLESINKTTTDFSLLRQAQARKAEQDARNNTKDKAASPQIKQVGEKVVKTGEAMVTDIVDDSEKKSKAVTNTTGAGATAGAGAGAGTSGTVKIKMGLLQAVKRLKPSPSGEDTKKAGMDKDEDKMDTDDHTNPAVTEEDHVPSDIDEYAVDESSSSSSSSSSSNDGSSSSGSSDDNSSENEDKNKNKDDKPAPATADTADENDDDNEADDDGSDSSDESESEDDETPVSATKSDDKEDPRPDSAEFETPDIQVIISSDEESESSDNSDEVDLVSSEEEPNDDEKDTDYKASADEEDEDIIMISDDEFKSKGRAVIPSPPHSEKVQQMGREVLVDKVPDFDPIFTSMMSSESKDQGMPNE